MFRTISISVENEQVTPEWILGIGTKGSSGVAQLAITFGAEWDLYTDKRITFFDANSAETPVEVLFISSTEPGSLALYDDGVWCITLPSVVFKASGTARAVIDAWDGSTGHPVTARLSMVVTDTDTPGGGVDTPEIDAVLQLLNTAQQAISTANALLATVQGAEISTAAASEIAVQKAAIATQALSDLLAMMGRDIATLTGGKIPMSQIPATATQEIYTVASEAELTGLAAQRGDLAELLETVNGEQTVTKTWQCLGDATVRDNWVVWGTSYAVQAGSSTTAGTATDATMINGHRLVEMTAAQYAAAVKDADTYYLVSD